MSHEPQHNYMTKPKTTFSPSENYVTAEKFRVEAKKHAPLEKNCCNEYSEIEINIKNQRAREVFYSRIRFPHYQQQ